MNIKETLQGIKNTLRLLKNSQWRLGNQTGKILPGSIDVISGNKSKISEIGQAITSIAPYRQPRSKKKSSSSETTSVKIRIFHNRHLIEPMVDTQLKAGDVAIAAIDSFGNALDARIPGGGLKPEYLEFLKGNTIMVNSYTDVGFHNGLPTTASAAFIVELPKSILTTFKSEEVLSIVKKYCALGSVPVILYY